jgi:nucleotide-binding universal stress UspA family protein
MGSRVKKGLHTLLIGSVASKVVSLAPCSVLIVR